MKWMMSWRVTKALYDQFLPEPFGGAASHLLQSAGFRKQMGCAGDDC